MFRRASAPELGETPGRAEALPYRSLMISTNMGSRARPVTMKALLRSPGLLGRWFDIDSRTERDYKWQSASRPRRLRRKETGGEVAFDLTLSTLQSTPDRDSERMFPRRTSQSALLVWTIR